MTTFSFLSKYKYKAEGHGKRIPERNGLHTRGVSPSISLFVDSVSKPDCICTAMRRHRGVTTREGNGETEGHGISVLNGTRTRLWMESSRVEKKGNSITVHQ